MVLVNENLARRERQVITGLFIFQPLYWGGETGRHTHTRTHLMVVSTYLDYGASFFLLSDVICSLFHSLSFVVLTLVFWCLPVLKWPNWLCLLGFFGGAQTHTCWGLGELQRSHSLVAVLWTSMLHYDNWAQELALLAYVDSIGIEFLGPCRAWIEECTPIAPRSSWAV